MSSAQKRTPDYTLGSQIPKNTGPGTSADDDEEVSEGSYSETKPNDREFRGKGRRRHRSHESSSPPTTGSSRSGSVPTVPTIDPPASQRRATTSGTYGRQPAYGQQGFPPLAIDPALIGPGGPTNYPPPSSYTPPGHTLAHLHSATPIDAAGTRDEGIASRLRARTQMSRSPPPQWTHLIPCSFFRDSAKLDYYPIPEKYAHPNLSLLP
ncbi:hypothetical protein B0H10DRAFT_2199895, partial [Mycena sp. CBHHK59/15]